MFRKVFNLTEEIKTTLMFRFRFICQVHSSFKL